MKYQIIEKESFSVIGKSALISNTDKYQQLPNFWQACHNDRTIEYLHSIAGDIVMGIGSCADSEGNFNYMIGARSDIQPPQNWESWIVPKSLWVIFEPVISTPDRVGSVWEYIFNVFFSQGNYQHANTFDLEVNYRMKNTSKDYTCEIWIPVVNL